MRRLAVLAVGAAAVRLLWLHAPLERDEAGYLLMGGQWHPGTSLYGNYWVDRPPLLIGFFALAHLLGGIVALRVLGCLLAALTVVLAYGLGRALREESGPPLWPALAAASFVSSPLFGVTTVNGELIAVPLVLAGLLAVVRGRSTTGARRRVWWLAAGALAAGACLVKQDFLDVFVFAGALTVAGWTRRRTDRARARAGDLGWLVTGAVGLTVVVLGLAELRGTTPGGLWNALVVFRGRAALALSHFPDPAAAVRRADYPRTLVLSGAALLLAALPALLLARRRSAVLVATVCTFGWEVVAIVASQQYWNHYLICLAPGLVLVAALATAEPGALAWWARAVTGYAAAATLVAVAVTLPSVLGPSRNQGAGEWLRAAAHPGDQAVVLFGQPNILQTAGLGSPYPQLWSLPILVEDPRLNHLVRILRGPRAPVWVLVDRTRHLSPARAVKVRAVLRARYVPQVSVCRYRVYLRVGVQRAVPPRPGAC